MVCPYFVKVSQAHATISQLPIRSLALYYLPLSMGCVRYLKRASKGPPEETSVVLLIIITMLLIPDLSLAALVLQSEEWYHLLRLEMRD